MPAPQIAQMDVGPALPGLCAITGLILFPATILAWGTLRGRRRSVGIFIPVLLTVLAAVWCAAAIDEYFFEPKIDDTLAGDVVEDLPEVRQYLQAHPDGKSLMADLDHQPPNMPPYTVQFDVGDPNHPWHKFRVELVHSGVSVFDSANGWMPIEQWRQLPPKR
jgi:hypothetical protein